MWDGWELQGGGGGRLGVFLSIRYFKRMQKWHKNYCGNCEKKAIKNFFGSPLTLQNKKKKLKKRKIGGQEVRKAK